jgi:isocitrate/isopropylmalate dehydrogenase
VSARRGSILLSVAQPQALTSSFDPSVLPSQIGKEITGSVKEVFAAMNVPVEWEEYDVSGETHGSERLFNEAMESLRRNKVGLKGGCSECKRKRCRQISTLTHSLPLLSSFSPLQVSCTHPSMLLLTIRGT